MQTKLRNQTSLFVLESCASAICVLTLTLQVLKCVLLVDELSLQLHASRLLLDPSLLADFECVQQRVRVA